MSASHSEHIEMHDRITIRSGHDIDDTGEEGLTLISSRNDRTGPDPLRLGGIAQERPHVSGVIDLIHIRTQRHHEAEPKTSLRGTTTTPAPSAANGTRDKSRDDLGSPENGQPPNAKSAGQLSLPGAITHRSG